MSQVRVDQAADQVACNGTDEAVAGYCHKQLHLAQAERYLAVGRQSRGTGFGAGLDELIGKRIPWGKA